MCTWLSVAMGANPAQLLKAMTEAEAYHGPSLIIAYAPCINHGINMGQAQAEIKKAVDCRLLDAVPLQSRTGRAGQEPAHPGFQGAQDRGLSGLPEGRSALRFSGQDVPRCGGRSVREERSRRSGQVRQVQEPCRIRQGQCPCTPAPRPLGAGPFYSSAWPRSYRRSEAEPLSDCALCAQGASVTASWLRSYRRSATGLAQGVVPLDPGLRAFGAQGCWRESDLTVKLPPFGDRPHG